MTSSRQTGPTRIDDVSSRRKLPAGEAARRRLVLLLTRRLVADTSLSKAAARELAFHLTDWHMELAALAKLYEHIEKVRPAKAVSIIYKFLAHAPHHVTAAYRILYEFPVTQTFGLGEVKGTGRATRKPGAPYPASVIAKRLRRPRPSRKPKR